ncbi:MAG: LysR family transcriptional regulator [Lachnospiraceae bacterium]|nr:LysR family transcriptional regulator [Lachnospiraceae bacterium]
MTKAEIEAFLMVAKEKNMTLAASKMFISQSSLSLRIKTLEKEIGCELLIRNRGGHAIELTAKGEEFQELAMQYQELTEKMLSIGKQEEKKLRIGAVNSISSYLLPDVCEHFMEVHPDAQLEVHDFEKTAEICTWLEHKQIDLAFAGGSTYKRKVQTVPLFREHMLVVCSRQMQLGPLVKIEELNVENEVYCNWFTDFIQWHDEKFVWAKKPAIFVSNMTQLTRFLGQSGRWAFVPATVAHGLLSMNQNLASYEIEDYIPMRQTNLLLPARKELAAFQKDFLNNLIRYVEENYAGQIEMAPAVGVK